MKKQIPQSMSKEVYYYFKDVDQKPEPKQEPKLTQEPKWVSEFYERHEKLASQKVCTSNAKSSEDETKPKFTTKDFSNLAKMLALLENQRTQFSKCGKTNDDKIQQLKLIIESIQIVKTLQSKGQFNPELCKEYFFSDHDTFYKTMCYIFNLTSAHMNPILYDLCNSDVAWSGYTFDALKLSLSNTAQRYLTTDKTEESKYEKFKYLCKASYEMIEGVILHLTRSWKIKGVTQDFQEKAFPLIVKMLIEKVEQQYIAECPKLAVQSKQPQITAMIYLHKYGKQGKDSKLATIFSKIGFGGPFRHEIKPNLLTPEEALVLPNVKKYIWQEIKKDPSFQKIFQQPILPQVETQRREQYVNTKPDKGGPEFGQFQ